MTEPRIEHLKSKIATVKEQMQRLREIGEQMAKAPDGQVSLTDPDARRSRAARCTPFELLK